MDSNDKVFVDGGRSGVWQCRAVRSYTPCDVRVSSVTGSQRSSPLSTPKLTKIERPVVWQQIRRATVILAREYYSIQQPCSVFTARRYDTARYSRVCLSARLSVCLLLQSLCDDSASCSLQCHCDLCFYNNAV